jgi:3-hydroxyacyl-CoA dehydrogenase
VTPEAAAAGLARLKTLRPDPFFLPENARLIRPAALSDLDRIAPADWVIEAVIESLEVKRDLIARVEPHVGPLAILSSNTSAIPLAEIAAGRGDGLRRRWLGTHFFNPPRYLKLVELIPTAETDPVVVAALEGFLDLRLGKGVVVARDTPGFIANRLGIFGALRAIEAWTSGEFTLEEIDAVTGPPIGRPKSATFRTLDLAGLDVFASVAADLARRIPAHDGPGYSVPEVVGRMVEKGLLGAKTGQGFYKRVTTGSDSAILALDPVTLEYRPLQPARLGSLDAAAGARTLHERIRQLLVGPDRVGDLLRRTLGATLVYAARVQPEISGSIDDVDRAMRWGFGWELGPFETWDAIGIDTVVHTLGASPPPRLAAQAIERGRNAFRDEALPPAKPEWRLLTSARRRGAIVRGNDGASLVDLGDGVFAVELHSKMNILGGDALAMLRAGVAEAAAHGIALVIGSDAEHFSAGADLRLVLFEAQEGNWPEIDAMVREFQDAMMAVRNAAVPVIAAPAGLVLGGGCEICLHADRVQAAAETYIGLSEVGVGLIPAGGGTKEMLVRSTARTGDDGSAVRAAFETIGFARISTSAPDARRLGYLRDVDAVTMNRDRVIADAKAAAIARARAGYQPRLPLMSIPVGGADTYAVLALGIHLALRAGRISEHDGVIGRRLARVLAGGDLPHAARVSEAYLLDLEREAFLSLCGEPKTLERIAYTLKTGKPLRN